MDALEEVGVGFRLALFTVVIVILNLIFCNEPHAGAVLPDFAAFALDHKLPGVGIVLCRATLSGVSLVTGMVETHRCSRIHIG